MSERSQDAYSFSSSCHPPVINAFEPLHLAASPFVPPRDQFERALQKLWMEVLSAPPMGVQDDFFELGGDSVMGADLCARIAEEFGVPFSCSIVFEARTIEAQAAIFSRGQSHISRALTSVVCIQNHSARPPIFFLHVHDGMAAYCTKFAKYLGADQPVYGIHAQALAGKPPHRSVEEMARHYVQELRSVQPVGPYYLFGYCAGGRLAFEMAQQLVQQRQRVALLAMLDSPAPGSSNLGFFSPVSALTRKFKYEKIEFRKLRLAAAPGHFLGRFSIFARRSWRATLKKARRASAELFRRCGGVPRSWSDIPLEDVIAAASRKYRPANPFPGRIIFFHTPQLEFLYTIHPLVGWAPLSSSGIDVIRLAQNAAATPDEEQARAISAHLRSFVDMGIASRTAFRS
jgi:hypothetical protein